MNLEELLAWRLMVVHVDDILWTGGKAMEEKMDEVVKHCQFGKTEKTESKYCGQQVLKDEKGM